MEKIEKEIAELKKLVSKLLEIQEFDHKMKYGYLDMTLNSSTCQESQSQNQSF